MMDINEEILRCRKWIEDALEYSGGTHDFDDIVRGIYEQRMQLWPSEKGCIVTELVVYPKKKVKTDRDWETQKHIKQLVPIG